MSATAIIKSSILKFHQYLNEQLPGCKDNHWQLTINIFGFQEEIGKALHAAHIAFESEDDLGYSDFARKSLTPANAKQLQKYIEHCKNTASFDFLNAHLDKEFQHEILSASLEPFKQGAITVEKLDCILTWCNHYKKLGVNPLWICPEVEQLVNVETIHQAIKNDTVQRYLTQGFYFNEKLLLRTQKDVSSIHSMTEINRNNLVRFEFLKLNNKLSTPQSTHKKTKI